ncbi:hypothetical protein B0H11DRAFT_1855744 [Mycena galericulata]|nr:hypothetical protein B0H11DRAFT_1855744 [Mycena galericulata]
MGISLSTTYVPSWQDACAATFNCSSSGLVNILGEPIFPICPANGSIPPEVWGITRRACEEHCGMELIMQSIEFSPSAITIATWLLPWIALIAQLPFEANGWMDLLSACLCVGSPALAAYSLALTAFNRRYIARQFQKLKYSASKDIGPEYYYMVERVDAAAFILQESQQCPMRADQTTGELGNLIVMNDTARHNFWKSAAKDLRNTRRGFTYSFLAQVVVAFATYLISFIAAVHDSLGDPDVGLQFASSTVWSWMFPIVFGYIRVGSQYQAGCVKEAFVHGSTSHLHEPSFVRIEDRGQDRSTQSLLPRNCPGRPPPPTWYGFDVRGDERREGPIFNYARILTWFAFAEHVRGGFETSIKNFQDRKAIPKTVKDAADRCGFRSKEDLIAFTAWSRVRTPVIQHIFGAAFVALFLQWGTTGAAIFVAYNTPSVGLGCRSGSYLIYGIASTASWVLLVTSALFSHAAMQRLEKKPDRKDVGGLAAMAVVIRLLGKTIAISNAAWLIASTVMEDIGTFQTCWCQTDAAQYGENGWTPVFKNASALSSTAGGIWIGGFVWSITASIITGAFFEYDRGELTGQ